MIAIVRNTAIRRALGWAVPWIARLQAWRFERRIDAYFADQARLRARYGIAAATPIRGYDEVTRASVMAIAEKRPDVRLAYTSGSTSTPKALAYPPERLRSFKADSGSAGVRAVAVARLKEPTFFILSSMASDQSFASLVVVQRGEPSLGLGLIEPARYLFMPALRARVDRYGATAVRLWLMVISNVGLVYSTNPSTLAVFLSEIHDDWARSSAMIRAWVRGEDADPALDRIAARVITAGARARLALVAEASSPPPIASYLPAWRAYCCWDGGYVTNFLRQIHRWLPPDRYLHLPMYAMSTETIQTLPRFGADGAPVFLPLGPEVLYEFLPEDAPDDPSLLIGPRELQAGRAYAMVVSDPYGLVRYQTDDLFACRGHVRGVPDLRFLRRRGLTWSFTGEKLTGEQLALAYAQVEAEIPALEALGAQLTTMPSWPEGQATPNYRVLVGHPGRTADGFPEAQRVAAALDAALSAINGEYADKRRSGRLGAPQATLLPYDQIAEALDAQRTGGAAGESRAWESQFKLMPLTRRKWEDVFG